MQKRDRKRLSVAVFLVLVFLLCFFVFSCTEQAVEGGHTYVLNVRTKKIHKETCGTAERINAENKERYSGEIEDLFVKGYTVCGNCF